ncbi:MAG TPA: hypothetical protein VIX37_19400 [Candidatus Sulfotelmatobacter sp.]
MSDQTLVLFAVFLLMPSAILHAQSAAKNDNDDPNVRPPVTTADVKIVQSAKRILDSPAKWNRADTRVCPKEAKTYSFYCALEKATDEVTGNFQHRSAAMQEARFVITKSLPNEKTTNTGSRSTTTTAPQPSLTSRRYSSGCKTTSGSG